MQNGKISIVLFHNLVVFFCFFFGERQSLNQNKTKEKRFHFHTLPKTSAISQQTTKMTNQNRRKTERNNLHQVKHLTRM